VKKQWINDLYDGRKRLLLGGLEAAGHTNALAVGTDDDGPERVVRRRLWSLS